MILNGGIISDDGNFFVLCETSECDEDEAVICSGRADGNTLRLRAITPPAEFVSLQPLTGEWADAYSAVVLTAQGELFLLRPDFADREFIPGSGYGRADSLNLGRMTMLKQVGADIHALGYGGQVYHRRVTTEWQANHVTADAMTSGYDVCLYDVVRGPGGVYYFGGTDVSKFERTQELIDADEEDDEERWLDLLLATPSGDRMGLRAYDGTWTDIGIEFQGAITVILKTEAQAWTVFSNYGVAWRTEDFASFDEVIALGERRVFLDIKSIGARVFVLVGQQLNEFFTAGLEPFEPALPVLDEGYTNISGNSEQMCAFHATGVSLLRDAAWNNLTVTLTE